ncbi:MAG TPA: ANTAR domain-containing protein [Acidimicrobiales bacterium]|nr:ANTAR domain-containing protein [Acidimicrobiales bacterium]
MTDTPESHAPQDQLSHGLNELATLVLANETLGSVLQRVVDLACTTLEGCDWASVTLVEGENAVTAAASAEEVHAIDEGQYRNHEGPCLQAIRDGLVHRIDDTAASDDFRAFNADAVRRGVRACLGLPLLVDSGTSETSETSETIGALNLYSRTSGVFRDPEQERAAHLAERAAVAVANAHFVDAIGKLVDQLRQAVESRDLIGQAKGILMARQQCDADTAFDILRRASQRKNRKLHDIAATIVSAPLPPVGDPHAATPSQRSEVST